MICQVNNTHLMSNFCINSWNLRKDEEVEGCVPKYVQDFGYVIGCWYLINSIIGAIGNLCTLVAIPYAAKRKRFNFLLWFSNSFITYFKNPVIRFHFHDKWSSTYFILNLAFVDLVLSVVFLPIQAHQLIVRKWPWGMTSCRIMAMAYYSNSFLSFMSVVLIQIDRCATIVYTGRLTIFSKKRNRLMTVILNLTWCLVPIALGVSQWAMNSFPIQKYSHYVFVF